MHAQPSDAELLAAIRDGDRAAFELLYERYGAWLLARLRRRCADQALVEEAVQETFLVIWRGASQRAEGDITGWLWRIGMRRLIELLRGTSRAERLWQRLTSRWTSPDEPSAEERVLSGIEHGDLAGAIGRLSPELRAVLQATVLDGLSTNEAAGLLGIPAGTVKTRAMRARAQLRRELT